MEAFDNEIYYFDSAEYLQTINKLLSDHKEEIIKEPTKLRRSFVKALETAQLNSVKHLF